MPRQVVEIRVRKKGDGVIVDGMTRSDRGTKYVLKTMQLDYKGLDKKERTAKMFDALEKLLKVS